jgi:hypothetical protein
MQKPLANWLGAFFSREDGAGSIQVAVAANAHPSSEKTLDGWCTGSSSGSQKL